MAQRQHSRYKPLALSEYAEDYAPAGLQMAPDFPRLFPRQATERWRRQMGRFTNQPRGGLQYPTTNGHFDPLSIASLMDLILRSRPPEMRVSVSWLVKSALPRLVVSNPSSTNTTVKPRTNIPVLSAMRLR